MKYSRGTFLLGCALVAGSTAVSAQTLEPSRISRIDELVAKAMSELPIRGVSIVATRAGTTVFDRAYGFADGETKVAATSSTRYPVGSITKSFTAAAILALRDSKRIDLDAPIGRYVPEAGKGSAVPIRLLLEQRSGIPNFFGDYVWERNLRNATAAEMLATMASAPLDFVPGALFEYPNTNYLLLGLAIERITKQPYFSVLKRLVIDPARLQETALVGEPNTPHAVGYQRFTNPAGAPIGIPDGARMYWGAGALLSSARDLAAWDVALLDGRVIAASSMREMMTPVSPVSPLSPSMMYAMGWFVDSIGEVTRVRHSGLVPGFSCSNDLFPSKKMTLTVCCNLSRIPIELLAERIGAELLGVPSGEGTIFPPNA